MRRKLLLLLFLLLIPFALAAEGTADGITVNLYGGERDEIGSIAAWEKDGEYWLFLPGQAYSGMRVFLDGDDFVTVDGMDYLENGEDTDLFNEEGEYMLEYVNRAVMLHIVKGSDIPAVYINTNSGSMEYVHADKRHKEGARILIYENGICTYDTALKYIKGRGNSTWTHDKKSYNIKFKKKTDFLGMGKEKKWTLLGNDVDPTLIRNVCGWTLAEKSGLRYTSDFRYVDLYLNGIYRGNYIICDSVEVGEDRVDITDLEMLNELANDSEGLEEFMRPWDEEKPEAEEAEEAEEAAEAAEAEKEKEEEKQEKQEESNLSWVDTPAEPEDISGGYLLEMALTSR